MRLGRSNSLEVAFATIVYLCLECEVKVFFTFVSHSFLLTIGKMMFDNEEKR